MFYLVKLFVDIKFDKVFLEDLIYSQKSPKINEYFKEILSKKGGDHRRHQVP